MGSNGKPLVVAFISTEDKIVISDVDTGETVFVLFGRLIFAGLISLYPFPVVILASGEEDISFTDAESGKICRLIEGGFGRVFRAVVSHDSSPCLIFTTWNHQNRRSTIQTYELGDVIPQNTVKTYTDNELCDIDKMRIMFEGDSRDGVSSLVVSRKKNPLICSGHYDFVVRVWDLLERKLLFILKGHIDWVVSVAIWKGSESLAVSGSSDGTIRIWDLQTGSLLTTCEGHLRDVWSVTVTEGPKHLIVSASVDRTVRSWDINNFLKDLKWERRKYFCLFLYCCDLIDREELKNYHHKVIGPPGNVLLDSEAINTKFDVNQTKIEEGDVMMKKKINMKENNYENNSLKMNNERNEPFLNIEDIAPNLMLKKRDNIFDFSASFSNIILAQSEIHVKSISFDEIPSNLSGNTKKSMELVFQSLNLCREIVSFL